MKKYKSRKTQKILKTEGQKMLDQNFIEMQKSGEHSIDSEQYTSLSNNKVLKV